MPKSEAPPIAKEPWQMTKAEFETWYKERFAVPDLQGHKMRVMLALERGKPVPPEVLKDYPDLMTKEGNPGMAPDKRLLKVAIEREPLKIARQLGYEVHRLSATDIVDKADYASGFRFRLSKGVPNQPYPQIIMARSEGEVATFLKRQIEGNPITTEEWKESFYWTAVLRDVPEKLGGKYWVMIETNPQGYERQTIPVAPVGEEDMVLKNLKLQEGYGKKVVYPPEILKGNPDNGTCYEDAWRFVIKEEEGDLIHGSVESKGKRIGHAWVELPTGFIWEPETGRYFTREAFNIATSPIEEHRYTVEEAAIMLARVGKHGPWTGEEKQRILGGNPMPRTEAERLSFHERIFGKGSPPPLERLGRGQTANDLLPMPPDQGPPLPRVLAIKWPWK